MDDAIGNRQVLATGSLGMYLNPAEPNSSLFTPQVDQCIHFWVIDSPNGPSSQGTCKLCGKSQLFHNSVSNSMWNRGVARREDAWL